MKDNINRISLRTFLLLLSALLIIIPTVILSVYNSIQTIEQVNTTQSAELQDMVELIGHRIDMTNNFTSEIVRKDLEILEANLNSGDGLKVSAFNALVPIVDYSTKETTVPALEFMGNSYAGIDDLLYGLNKMTEASFTVFQPFEGGILRVATSIKNAAGKSARGSFIRMDSAVYKSVIKGKTYTGRAMVLGEWYSTIYKPVVSSDGKLLYVLFAGKPESLYFESLFSELSTKVLGDEGYYYILDTDGNYVLSSNRERDGENIIDAADVDGNKFVINMITTAVETEDINLINYAWQNNGESEVRAKIAAYQYIPQLDWVICASDYADRADGIITERLKKQAVIIVLSIIGGMAISLLLTNVLYRSFSDLQENIRFISEGDFISRSGKSSIFKDIFVLQETLVKQLVPKLTSLISQINQKSAQIVMMSEVLEFNINQSLGSIDSVSGSTAALKDESEKLNDLMLASGKSALEIVGTVNELNNSVSDQSSSVSQISASIEESNASLQNVSRVVQEKFENAQELVKAGEVGKAKVGNTNNLIKQINTDIELLLEINEIINTITEQSKLLAMNAAIEAAHAGEKGRGFAIVAGEMRQLANTTAENGLRISETLKVVQNRINTASSQSEETLSIIQHVTDDIFQFTEAFQEIADSTTEISAGTTQILQASNLLSDLSEETLENSSSINRSISQLSEAVQRTTEGAESSRNETIALMGSLEEVVVAQDEMKKLGYLNASMGTELSGSLEIFNYEDDITEHASVVGMIRAHQLWVKRVARHLDGTTMLDSVVLGDHHSCALGKWLDSSDSEILITKHGYGELLEKHEELHRIVTDIVGNDSTNSDDGFLKLKNLSHNVINLLLSMTLQ